MAAAEKSVTVTQIRLDQAHAEEQVMAQSALIGERAVAWVRLLMLLLIGASTSGAAALDPLDAPPSSAIRPWLVAFYFTFTLATIVITQRTKKARPERSMWIPMVFIFVDAGFFLGQTAIAASLNERPKPEIVAVTFALLICFSVARARTVHAVVSTAVSIFSVGVIAYLQKTFSPIWTSFVCGCLLAEGALIIYTNRRIRQMFVEIRRHDNLSRFLPRQVVERVLSTNGSALNPVQREVTVLFSDIRSFTTMSESMPPREVLEFLDGYFGHMGQIVRGHEGMLNKFLGDGLLAVWGVPDNQDDHAERGIKAAMDMRRKMVEINRDRTREGKAPFKIGIGVHTGIVAAGMLGGADQREYTVIGDAVNLASRIEGLTKAVGVDILASERAWTLGGQKFKGARVGEEHVKGRAEGVIVYAVQEPA